MKKLFVIALTFTLILSSICFAGPKSVTLNGEARKIISEK